ncbi:hypothetical protein LPJ64_003724 [Coemansia asiatica]|uniref:Uncharacterized protein n=1 Tax=Coemansia asiatica TaxID=1052880 RepID=A0A9W7XKB1_9FUNG|nr:hypothetical protein LPJ64_003724 [Coemansia asiatica]
MSIAATVIATSAVVRRDIPMPVSLPEPSYVDDVIVAVASPLLRLHHNLQITTLAIRTETGLSTYMDTEAIIHIQDIWDGLLL